MTSVNRIQLNELRGDSDVGVGTPAEKRGRVRPSDAPTRLGWVDSGLDNEKWLG